MLQAYIFHLTKLFWEHIFSSRKSFLKKSGLDSLPICPEFSLLMI